MVLRWLLIVMLTLTVAGFAPGNAALSNPATADLIGKSLTATAAPAPARPDAKLASGSGATPAMGPAPSRHFCAAPTAPSPERPAVKATRYLHPQPQAPPSFTV